MKLKNFRKSKTLSIGINKEEVEYNKPKKKINKSNSFKNVRYSMNSVLDNYSSINNINNGKLPNIRTADDILAEIKAKIIFHKNLPFFITDKNGIKIIKTDKRALNFRKRLYLKKTSHFNEFLNFNVFNEKDCEIKELINKFNKQIEMKKINKIQRRKNILNKLYGITPNYNKILKKAKSQKSLSLEKYQDNILTALNSNGMYSSESLSELYQKFKNIKTDIETVIPYPKIKIKNIINHFQNRIKTKNDKMMSLKEYLSKKKLPKDNFEREEKKIISLKLKKNNNRIARIQHDNLYMLPLHIRKLFIK